MEHESFENEAIGALLNKYFVSIKVDREERPDVDKMYMTFIQVRKFFLLDMLHSRSVLAALVRSK